MDPTRILGERKSKRNRLKKPSARSEESRVEATTLSSAKAHKGSAATPKTPFTADPGDTTASHLPDRARGGGHHHSRTARDGKAGEADHDLGHMRKVQAVTPFQPDLVRGGGLHHSRAAREGQEEEDAPGFGEPTLPGLRRHVAAIIPPCPLLAKTPFNRKRNHSGLFAAEDYPHAPPSAVLNAGIAAIPYFGESRMYPWEDPLIVGTPSRTSTAPHGSLQAQSIIGFFQILDRQLEAHTTNPLDWLRMLHSRLTGRAAKILDSLRAALPDHLEDPAEIYDHYRSRLIAQFTPPGYLEALEERMASIRQDPSDDLATHLAKFLQLRECLPTGDVFLTEPGQYKLKRLFLKSLTASYRLKVATYEDHSAQMGANAPAACVGLPFTGPGGLIQLIEDGKFPASPTGGPMAT